MNLRRLYPLDGFPQQRQLWSWISYDVANQSFTLIINTLLFSTFFQDVVVRDKDNDDSIWALTFGTSMLLTALLSPLAGAMADERACKKGMLMTFGLICGILTCCFGLIQPGQLWFAVLLYIPANFAFAIGENFLACFLPSLGPQEQVGRISGFSWAVAYASALVILGLTGVMISALHWSVLGVFVFAGLWFLAFIIPTALWLKEPALARVVHPGRNILTAGFVRLAETVRETARFRDLAMLMIASLFYATGMNVVVFFASILAQQYGFQKNDLVVFVAVITVSGIIGTIIPTLYQDKLGHRRSVTIFLGIWVATAVGFACYARGFDLAEVAGKSADYPRWPLWLIGNLLGFGLGSLGSANRAFVSYLAPPSKEGEVFGIWGLMWKLSAIMTFPFAWVKDKIGTFEALLVLAGFLIAGFVLTLFIDERRGYAAAHSGTD